MPRFFKLDLYRFVPLTFGSYAYAATEAWYPSLANPSNVEYGSPIYYKQMYDLEIPWSKAHLLSSSCLGDTTVELDYESATKCNLGGGSSIQLKVIGRVPDINWRVTRDFYEKSKGNKKQ